MSELAKITLPERPQETLVASRDDPTQEAECLKCRDARWLYYPGPRITADGSLNPHYGDCYPCPDCNNEAEHRQELLYRASGIPEARKVNNLASIKILPGNRAVMDLAFEMASGSSSFRLLTILGQTGNGKTHIAYGIGLDWMQHGQVVRFWPVLALLRAIKAEFDKPEEERRVFEQCKTAALLILDDLGAEQGTPWQGQVIEELIDYRWANKLALVVTSNRDWKTFSAPVQSRLADRECARMVVNTAPDYRQTRKG